MRKQRMECLHLILEEYNFILNKDPKAMVVILGDFNIEHHLLQKHIQTVKTALTCLPILGNGLTFHQRSTKWSTVDSILVNPAAVEELVPAQTVQEWITYSDHFPLVTHLVSIAEKETETEMAPKYCFNIDLVKGHGKGIVHSN